MAYVPRKTAADIDPFIALSLVGVAFLTGVNLNNFHLGIGELMAMVSAVGFNAGFLMSRYHKKERNNYENTTILLLIGWVPVCIVSLVLQEPLPQHITPAAWVGLALASVFNIVALYATNYIFTNVKAYVAGNILLLESVWAIVLGAMLYAEPVTSAVLLGGLLIVASAIAVNTINNKNEAVQTELLDESAIKE